MALKVNRSRVENVNTSTAKTIASPRAEAHAAPQPSRNSPKKSSKKSEPVSDLIGEVPRRKSAGKAAKAKTGKVLKSELAYQGKVFNVYKDTVIEPNGKENTREVIRHSGSVVVLAVDEAGNPDDPTVILIRQYRHAAGQFLIELPAGRIDANEAPLAAAKREMIEETGFRAKRWTLLVKYFASPGFLGEWMQIYLAQGITSGEATPEEDEQIELLPTPLSEAMQLIADGKIHDGKTLIGLSLYSAARIDRHL
jgi:ADP-ribose pyrophosphatase